MDESMYAWIEGQVGGRTLKSFRYVGFVFVGFVFKSYFLL